jgi:hypothetical protein
VGEALIREADNLACQSWNEKMWSDGGPIDPSPTIEQAINGGFPWLEIECSRCRTARDVDLFALHRPLTAYVHDLAGADLSEMQSRRQATAGNAASASAPPTLRRRLSRDD